MNFDLTEEMKKQLDYMIAQRRCPHRHPCVSFLDEDIRDYLAAAIAALGSDALRTCGKNGLVTDLRGYIGRRAITVLMAAIANLFAIGGASCMSRALERHDEASPGALRPSISFWWCLAAGVLFSGVFTLFTSPLLYLCWATAYRRRFCWYACWHMSCWHPH